MVNHGRWGRSPFCSLVCPGGGDGSADAPEKAPQDWRRSAGDRCLGKTHRGLPREVEETHSPCEMYHYRVLVQASQPLLVFCGCFFVFYSEGNRSFENSELSLGPLVPRGFSFFKQVSNEFSHEHLVGTEIADPTESGHEQRTPSDDVRSGDFCCGRIYLNYWRPLLEVSERTLGMVSASFWRFFKFKNLRLESLWKYTMDVSRWTLLDILVQWFLSRPLGITSFVFVLTHRRPLS